jgi:FkbM family methyltransferase
MLKGLLKSSALRLGFEVTRFVPALSHAARQRAMLRRHHINLVLDVGANDGQYGRELRDHVGYTGRIISFEPMQAAHASLSGAAATDPLWQVAPRTAVGAREGTVMLNIAGNSASSSILPMLDAHASAAPESRYVGTEEVALQTLDSLAAPYFASESVAFLKIDTQGYESDVLDGATRTLERVAGLQLELSLVPLYAGQQLMPELMARVGASGFELWALSPAFVDPGSGRLLQLDAVFFRPGT